MKVELVTPDGVVFDLTGTAETSPVLAPEGQLRGLVGNVSRTNLAVPGRAGVLPGQVRFGEIESEVEFYLRAFSGDELAEVYAQFRRAWSLWGAGRPVVIRVHSPSGVWSFDAWAAKPLPGIDVVPSTQLSVRVPVTVFIPTGLARSETYSRTGNVTIRNDGDVLIYPRLVWSGPGGQVVAPSGATFVLPPVEHATTLDLDTQEVWLEGVWSEAVAPGLVGTWRVPTGVRIEWEQQVADPWT